MFTAAANPYDELITKATDENLASEDWALNLEVCDKVSSEGQTGARNAVGALQKRLAHRNPSVQLYALELANTLAQNCSRPLLEELSSRNWTGALERLINDRATPAPVKKKALGYIKAWAKQFEETGDRNLGIMGELYDQLRAKNMQFDEPEPAPENAADARQRQEDEELQRVLELSKQDKGGRNAVPAYVAAAQGGSSSSRTQAAPQAQSQPTYYPQQQQQQAPAYSAPLPPVPEPEAPLDVNTATRVRALYAFATTEVGELSFERGDVIKVLDRGFKEWWRGACNGKIGIFPVTYVEALAEPSPRELQDEAQEEARVFASLGLVDQLLQTLKGIDPSRGDRIEDKPEIEDMYQASVGLQGQINALIKKYSDQKAELEHMNANFLRAMKQYEELRNGPPPPAQYGYAAPPHDPHAAQYAQQPPQHAQQPQLAQPLPSQPQHQASYSSQNAGYAAAPGEHQYQTYSDQPPSQQHQAQHPPQPSEPAQYPAHDPYSHSQMPQAVPYQANGHYAPSGPVQHGSHTGQPGQPFYQQQQGGSVSSLNRAPSGAPSLPPNGAPQRQATHSGAAGIGAGSDADREHKAAWDAYYAQQNQNQPEGQHYPTEQPPVDPASVQYGASPYLAQQWPQQGQVPRSVSGTSGVDQVTGGMNRMTVGQ